VVSLCAGLALAELEPHVNGAALVRAMPIIAARYGESPTCMFPDNAAAKDVLSRCGPTIALRSEDEFDAASVSACYSSWVLGVMARLTAWSEQAGLAPDTARQIVTEMTRAAAIMARERTDCSIDDLVDELATPRSFTRIGYENLVTAQAFEPWNDAAKLVFDKLRS
ncbi:MAG: pyrroline-5-carboxylate reductase family protein, partial [Hyphomicrobiales bacterium]